MSRKKEVVTDTLILDLLIEAGIEASHKGSDVEEIDKALRTASKQGTDNQGFPEYVAVSGRFVIVIEDKRDPFDQAKYVDEDETALLMDTPSIQRYAENGALHYAKHIVKHTEFKQVFAFGCSGTEKKMLTIRPIFVTEGDYKLLPPVRDFSSFSEKNIEEYFHVEVCNGEPYEKGELTRILNRAESLHEALQTHSKLGEMEKPLVVSAILLALEEPAFGTEKLTGETDDPEETDGAKIFEALEKRMKEVKVKPAEKKEMVLDKFKLIKKNKKLSQKDKNLGKSPLKYYAEYLASNVLDEIHTNSREDVLGRFYGEFIKYSGGDAQSLGIVITPRHITELCVELANVKITDKVFDPCCGTGGFLIAALNQMLKEIKNKSISAREKRRLMEKVKGKNLHGIEYQTDMFSIATTNMILRGDGKSNLEQGDFIEEKEEDLRKKGYTVGLMNPPYGQAKNDATADRSELKFLLHMLDSLSEGGRGVAVVPISSMTGKNKGDAETKITLLKRHTLEGVITLNPNTFDTGTNPCIAVFTAHVPHPDEKRVKFVDFRDDGYQVFRNIGLLKTSRADELRELLLDSWHLDKEVPHKFLLKTKVKATDEWIHAFYYFNNEVPDEKDFEKTMADYLTFEFNMVSHGRAYLFKEGE